MITYQNMPVTVSGWQAPASNVSISHSNQLEDSRTLGSLAPQLRVAGPLTTKISTTFAACNKTNYNLASGALSLLTGDVSADITIGGVVFGACYLDDVSVDIVPFAPVMVSASFSCLNPPTGEYMISGSAQTGTLTGYLAHGHNVVITNGSTLSDPSRESISYKVSCARTYSSTIDSRTPNNVFLDGIIKELNIKARNIEAFINASGYGETITIDPKNDLGSSIISGGFGMSANCEIVSQNLSVAEGDLLAGDIAVRDIIL